MPQTRPPAGRVLGLDLGEVRIGVAVCDPDRRLAVPMETISAGAPADLQAVARLVRHNDVTLVVVGHPVMLSGRRGARARHAEEFADGLRGLVQVPVVLHDERLSTAEADRMLQEAGAGGRERRRAVDRSAAAVILQAYLDEQAGARA
ncbi:MAG: Holliday junction resolvase RuvX [Actinomycetota bacterium]